MLGDSGKSILDKWITQTDDHIKVHAFMFITIEWKIDYYYSWCLLPVVNEDLKDYGELTVQEVLEKSPKME